MLEDTSSGVRGEFPGVDIDAVEIMTANDTPSTFATTVEDFNLGGGSALDTAQILGSPDANNSLASYKFVTLGGQDAGGYIIVGFEGDGQGAAFGAGSTVGVHEIDELGGVGHEDACEVSVSQNKDAFVQIGTANGVTWLPVMIDP